MLGGLVTAWIGIWQKDLPEVELAIGATLVLAWVVERGNRFGASGATLSGLGIGLLAVAISEAALQRLPSTISAPGVYRAFDDGWGFGLLITAYGVVVTVAASRSLRSL